MVSSLLDELPCLIDEADELTARLSYLMTTLKTSRNTNSTISVEVASTGQEVATDISKEDLKQSTSPRHSSSSHSIGKNRSSAELRQTLESIDMDVIVKFFARQFVTMQAMAFEKMNANLPTEDFERSALYAASGSTYQLMKRLHHWQQAAWESLARFFADNNTSETELLTFDSHPQLTRLVLATVAKYVKVNLLWTSFSIIPGLLSLYTFLHHLRTLGDSMTGTGAPPVVYSPLEHTDHRVREFVLHFGSAPLLAIQHDFQLQIADKGASLAALALSCFERYENCRDLPKLRLQGVFDLEMLVSGAYASHSYLPDLLNAAEIEDWVICVVLCVPHQLQSAGRNASSSRGSLPSLPSSPSSPTSTNSPTCLQLWEFMYAIARDRLVLTLHRNHIVNLHDLLYQQVTSSLSAAALVVGTASSSTMPSFGSNRSSVPLKKTMSVLSKYALRNSGVNHRQRREVAMWLLQNCVQLMRHNPGLVAPSFPLLLGALAIARDEVEWALCHGVFSGYKTPLLPSHIKAKHLQRVLPSFSKLERDVAELLTNSHRLRELIEQHSPRLAEYYQAFLVNGDADGIAYTIHELFTANESEASGSELLPLLEGFLDRERYRVSISSSPRVTWVREWRQANAHLATRTQLPLLDVLRARMECAVRHTQYIFASTQLIEHAANFSKCWWFRNVAFEQCFSQTLVTAPSCSIGLLEIVSGLAAGNYFLDELVDTEEAAQQAERMQRCMDQMRASLVDHIELGLEAVVKRDIILHRDEISVSQEEKPEQVDSKITASNRRLSSFSRVQSSQVQRPSNAEIRLASPTSSVLSRNNNIFAASTGGKREQIGGEEHYVQLVRALLDHIEKHRSSSVKSAVINRVQACFVRFVRGLVVFSKAKAENAALRCSVEDANEEIQCFLRATQRLFGGDSYASRGDTLSELSLGEALQVTLSNIFSTECSSLASILPQDKRLLEWTTDPPRVADKELQQWSLVDRVAWMFVCLVTRRCHPGPSTFQTSTQPPSVLASVRKNCFVVAPGISGVLDPRDYTDRGALQHLVGLIGSAGVESVCSTIANLLVAQILKLRSSIEAEHAVLAFMDMALSNNTGADVVLATAQVRALDDVATQLIQIGTAAFLLQLVHVHSPNATSDAWEARVAPRVLRELQQDPDRRATWTRLLPVACSSAFHSSVWKRTSYMSSLEATDTNAHMMGLAIARLLPQSSPSVHRCGVAALKRASTCTTTEPCTTRSKLPLQLDASSADSTTARPLLEALELLVATAASGGGGGEARGSTVGEIELELERLLPRALLVLHSAA